MPDRGGRIRQGPAMVDPEVMNSVQRYLRNLVECGIVPIFGVVFGSYATGKSDAWSDIDVLVVAPVFDGSFSREKINSLWRAAARTDSRIEPIACGERQWVEDMTSPIVEIARREGIRVPCEDGAAETPRR
jgi:hypothetical protein